MKSLWGNPHQNDVTVVRVVVVVVVVFFSIQLVQGQLKAGLANGDEDKTAEARNERTNMILSIVQQELSSQVKQYYALAIVLSAFTRSFRTVSPQDSATLDSFCSGCSRSVAARFFLEALQLKTWGKIELKQDGAFQPIHISFPQ